jgi:uncharacterized protein
MPYQISPTNNNKFTFNLKAENNEIILSSQVYEQKQSALDGIASVQVNGPDAANFEQKVSVANEPYFVLKAKNGEVIGKSQMYASKAAAEVGIASVQTNAPSTQISTAA